MRPSGAASRKSWTNFPQRLAVKDEKRQLTYAQLDEESDALAVALRKLGVKAGDRVATTLGMTIAHSVVSSVWLSFQVDTDPSRPQVIHACFKMGAILAPMNPSYSPQQAVSAVKHITAKCYILSTQIALPYKEPKSTASVWESALAACATPEANERKDSSHLRNIITVNNGGQLPQSSPLVWDLDSLLETNKGYRFTDVDHLHPQDTINLQFTSGTTSSPKAVSLSHWNILNNAYMNAHDMGYSHEDTIPCTMPLYHCGGMVLIILASMTVGACINFPCESFNALLTLQTIKEDKARIVIGVPTMFHSWLDLLSLPEFASHDFSHIRSGLIGASPILPSLRKELNERLHLQNLGNMYGMTETCPTQTHVMPDDPEDRKFSSVGRPIPHQTIRICNRDDPHCVLAIGEKGEVQASGMVMQGYWEEPAKTAEVIIITKDENGNDVRWMRSGDEGLMDADGFLTITGRIKDLIIRGT